MSDVGNLQRLADIENMAREAAKASGIIKALDQALSYGKLERQDYGGAFDAVADIADGLRDGLVELADEVNEERAKDNISHRA